MIDDANAELIADSHRIGVTLLVLPCARLVTIEDDGVLGVASEAHVHMERHIVGNGAQVDREVALCAVVAGAAQRHFGVERKTAVDRTVEWDRLQIEQKRVVEENCVLGGIFIFANTRR